MGGITLILPNPFSKEEIQKGKFWLGKTKEELVKRPFLSPQFEPS